MKLRIAIITAVICLAAAPAAAERRGLLILGNIDQVFDISYEFRNYDSETRSTSTNHRSHLVEEHYTIMTDYAVYNPRLWLGKASLGILFDQGMTSSTNRDPSSSTGWGFTYDVTGILFDKFPHPISFYARSETTSVLRDYGGSYEVATDSYGVALRYQNKYFPLNVSYNTVSTTTSGLGRDRIQDLETISFSGSYDLGKINRTTVNFLRSASSSRTVGNASLVSNYITERTNILNTTSWVSDERARSFSIAGGLIRESGDVSAVSWDAGGGFLWDIGRALSLKGDISNNRVNSPYRNEEMGRLSLRHRLFSSISTTIGTSYRKSSVTDGTEQEHTLMFGGSYQKKLPLEGLLTLNYSQTIGDIDRSGEISTRFEKVEAVASFTEPIIISTTGVELDAIKIYNHNPQVPVPDEPLIQYEQLVDYVADDLTGDITIFIVPGGAIREGQNIFIIYQVVMDPNLKYTSRSSALNGALSLWESRFRLYASLQETTQTPEGKSNSLTLGNYRTLEAGIDLNGDTGTFQFSAVRSDTPEERLRAVQASITKSFYLPEATLSIYAKERMGWRNTTDGNNEHSRRDNAFNIGIQYFKTIGNNMQVKIRTNYLNIRSRQRNDDLSLYGTFDMKIGKVFIELLPEIHWARTGTTSQLSERVRLQITRYF